MLNYFVTVRPELLPSLQEEQLDEILHLFVRVQGIQVQAGNT